MADRCLACGGELAPILRRTGSTRCHDCRDAHARLDARYLDGDLRPPRRLRPLLRPARAA